MKVKPLLGINAVLTVTKHLHYCVLLFLEEGERWKSGIEGHCSRKQFIQRR
jgi:hypothetical protein